MPQLKCTVQTCVHNKQFLCDLDEINQRRRRRCKTGIGNRVRDISIMHRLIV